MRHERQWQWRWMLGGCASLMLGVTLAGCGGSSSPQAESTRRRGTGESVGTLAQNGATAPGGPADEEHGHKPGLHGGILVSLGRDSYHAEAVFEAGGKLRLYMLGQDESRVLEVEEQQLKAFARRADGSEAVPFTLQPEPQEGDRAGRTSQFVASLPEGLSGPGVEVTIPNLAIEGERFRVGFASATADHSEPMPDRVADDEEAALYLTAGGKYTQSDIDANGRVTASTKFRGLKSLHDMSPKPGDRICPVTKTKANPKFTWIVNGEPYQFCCPPCVDEFVRTAKQSPDEIAPAAQYRKGQ
ncbi:MAG: hypothetical protein ACKOGA_22900 [Planctomycetaceae bacterium]